MHLFVYSIFGLIVGIAAWFFAPGREPNGWMASILIGLFGALLAGLAGRVLGLYEAGDAADFVMAVGGASVLLLAYHAFTRRQVSA